MPDREPILVVDDDESILGFVQMALEGEGYEVVRGRRPRLILLDLRMPAMDGWEFARVYREMPGPDAPTVVQCHAPWKTCGETA